MIDPPTSTTILAAVLLSLTLATTTGCGAHGGIDIARVGVLPLESAGLKPWTAQRLRVELGQAVQQVVDVPVVPPLQVDNSLHSQPQCANVPSKLPCAVQAGSRLGATHMISARVGALGETHVLQLGLIDVSRGRVTRVVDRTVVGGASAVQSALVPIAKQLLGVKPPVPWYRRWWLWTAVGVVAAGAAVAIALPLAAGGDEPPVVEVPLPLGTRFGTAP